MNERHSDEAATYSCSCDLVGYGGEPICCQAPAGFGCVGVNECSVMLYAEAARVSRSCRTSTVRTCRRDVLGCRGGGGHAHDRDLGKLLLWWWLLECAREVRVRTRVCRARTRRVPRVPPHHTER